MDSIHLILTFVIIAGAVIAFAVDRFSIEVVSLGILSALLVLFGTFPYTSGSGAVLSIDQLLAGFSSPALVTVLALLIVGKGLFATDALEGVADVIGRMNRGNPKLAVVVILVVVGVTSAFLNNTPVVVIFIPVLTSLAARYRLSPYQIFMPLSFVTILGGMTTMIGSSTNMIAVGLANQLGVKMGFFSITGMGVILAVVGYLYVLLVMPRVLSGRKAEVKPAEDTDGTQFVGDLVILPNSRFIGERPRSGFFPDLAPMALHVLTRADGTTLLPPYDDSLVLAPGDRLQLIGTRKGFMDLIAKSEFDLTAPPDGSLPRDPRKAGPRYHLAEAVVAPGSMFEGRTVRFSGIQARFNVTVFGVRRKSRMGRIPLTYIRLEAGDTLLLGGTEEDFASTRGNHDVLLLEHSAEPVPPRDKSILAALIFLAIVVLSATGISPIAVNAVAGAVLMVAFGCLTLQQAARAFDRQIFLLIGASIGMATALEATGGAKLIAETVVDLSGGASAPVVITILFITVAILTNLLSNNAAAALFIPIAINMARQVGAPPEAFAAAVIYAANCSFATPIGYQTNLMVMGPGHYSFRDFIRAGFPLVLVVTITFALVAPWYYDL
ncbi:SLC13 family permease [Martelella alba]|uniref:SLC13 family permease n=1 Tax=Martelella alba TaxID=2590451 RepID=A0A506U625_9HYPH|nr:SLC13 family permease [Martelella alba]TPW28561.1 SLC13 family permease [Martelella alba]